MKRLALLLALLALPPLVGCGSSKADTKPRKTAKSQRKSKKSKLAVDPHGKNYKKPQNVWGPVMLEEYLKNVSHSDPKERALAWKGLSNSLDLAKPKLRELKKQYAKEKDATVRTEAKRAIKMIERR